MATHSLEERVTALEAEVQSIKTQNSNNISDTRPWWERIVGMFKDDQEYNEAMRLGREYREALRSKEGEEAPLW